MTKRLKGILESVIRRIIRRLGLILHAELERTRARYQDMRQEGILCYLQCRGDNLRVGGGLIITDPRCLAIGHDVVIGEGAWMGSEGGITIGDGTRLGRQVVIHTVPTARCGWEKCPALSPPPSPVLIGRRVAIGANVTILPGVSIGDGALVVDGTVVTRDVPPHAVARPGETVIDATPDQGAGIERGEADRMLPVEDACVRSARGRRVHTDDPAARLVFVVSTGRSGSMTISKVLSQHPEIVCRHEPRPQMIRLSTELAHGAKSVAEVARELSGIFGSSLFPTDKWWGESDQKYWNLISILAGLIPRSRFIWLIRDGRDVVASQTADNWLSPEEERLGDPTNKDLVRRWFHYRLSGARCGCFSDEAWRRLPVFDRNCWAWTHVNQGIEEQLSGLAPQRWRRVRLEDLEGSACDLFHLLEVADAPVKVSRHNQAVREVARWRDWDSSRRTAFARWCAEGMNRWYPEWNRGADSGDGR